MNQALKRRLTYGSNATLVTLMVIAALCLLYVVAESNQVQWDLSEDNLNTLDPETLQKLRLLDEKAEKVEVFAFTAQSGKEDAYFKNRSMKDLLRTLGQNSQLLEWRQVDFDRERLTAERLGVNDYGRVVLKRGDDRVDIKDRDMFRRVGRGGERSLEFVGEAAISRGLSQLLTPRRRVVYVLSGHGDLDPTERGPDGLSELVAALDLERFDMETLDLMRTGRDGELPEVPDDAAVVFVARPQTPLSPQEEDTLLSYIGNGGPVLFSVDVGAPVPALLGRMGVRVPDGVVADQQVFHPHHDRPVPQMRSHAVTAELIENKLPTILVHPAPIRMQQPPPEGVVPSTVFTTSRFGWIELGGDLVAGAYTMDKGIDVEGPVDMVMGLELTPGRGLVRSSKGRTRALVVGDSEVFTNAMLSEGPGNKMFVVNAIHWLAGEDERLRAGGVRTASIRRLALTQQETANLRWLSLGVMPLVVVAFGVATWIARRGR